MSLQLLPFSGSAEHTETQVFKHFPDNSDHLRGVCMTQELSWVFCLRHPKINTCPVFQHILWQEQ